MNIPSRCVLMCPTRGSSELQLSNTPGEKMWSAPLFLKIGGASAGLTLGFIKVLHGNKTVL